MLDAHDLDGIAMQFDMINWMGNYHHLKDPLETLRKIYSKLKRGGLLTMEGRVLTDGGRSLKLPPDDEHRHSRYIFSIEEIVEQCKKCGFRTVELSSTIGDRALFRIVK